MSYAWVVRYIQFSTLRSGENARMTTFSNKFTLWKYSSFVHLSYGEVIPTVKSIISQHWFREWLGADQARNRSRNWWWSNLVTHVGVTRTQCVNYAYVLHRNVLRATWLIDFCVCCSFNTCEIGKGQTGHTEKPVHFWQTSPQLGSGDACQIVSGIWIQYMYIYMWWAGFESSISICYLEYFYKRNRPVELRVGNTHYHGTLIRYSIL